MADRFEKLFALPSNLYVEGSPLIISAGSLLKDTQTGKIITQIKFQNISGNTIKAVKVSLDAFDVSGEVISGVEKYQYLDLSVCNGAYFGSDKAIIMPNSNCRSIGIGEIVIIFSDNSVWSGNGKNYFSLQMPKKLQSDMGAELIKQYRIATTADAMYAPVEQSDYWICTCGTINKGLSCTKCHCAKDKVFSSYDVTTLTHAMNTRLEKERIEKEKIARQKEENEKQQRINKEKQKKKLITAGIIATIIIILLIVLFTLVIPSIKYNQATDLYNNGEYAKAAFLYSEIGNFSDAKEFSKECWDKIAFREVIASGSTHTIGVKNDGTVVHAGNRKEGQEKIYAWNNIIAVSAGCWHSVGLKADGKVVASGSNGSNQCNVSGWKNVVAIDAGDYHTVALLSNGTVVSTQAGDNNYGQCDVGSWKNIISVSAGRYHTVGLRDDGTVVATKFIEKSLGGEKYKAQCDVESWTNIVQVIAGMDYTIGLRSDGTVVFAGTDSRINVSGWRNIKYIAASNGAVVGVKKDGTVVCTGWMSYGEEKATQWTNISYVSAGWANVVGITSKGEIVATKITDDYWNQGQSYVTGWENIRTPQN